MYTNYFGLKEKPFSIAPDPRYLYMSEQHREALAHLLYGVSGDGCFILLTGDVGTGKTTVARCLLSQLPEKTDVAFIVNPRLTVLELLETICDEFGISLVDGGKSAKSYIDRLNVYLLEAHANGRNCALVIDEAQSLSVDLLEQLRLLTNLETDQKKLLKIVLLGQTELKQKLNQEGVAQISQRITSRYHLLALDRESSFAYIRHRLAVAGENQTIFSKTALNRIFLLSRGIPRLINVLCDRALLGAFVEEKYLVSAKIVDKAAQEVLGDPAVNEEEIMPKQVWGRLVLALLFIFLCVNGVLYYFNNKDVVISRINSRFTEVEGSEITSEKKTIEVPVEETDPVEERGRKASIKIIPLEISD